MITKEKLNSRKLLMAAATILIATGLLFPGLITSDNWVAVIIAIGGAYMATQAYVDRGNGK